MYKLTRHAIEQFKKRYYCVYGKNPNKEVIYRLLKKAKKEVFKNKTTKWHAFCRKMVYGQADYLIADGWRFVVSPDKVVITVERVKPWENYLV